MTHNLTGQNLGPYRVMEQLGIGGMATVYKGYQPSMDRFVAIKVLPRIFAQDPGFITRFAQEAKVIAKLEHARILPVYDSGEEEGVAYLVMRHLEGGTLADRLLDNDISLDETVRVITQIAEGLDYAHQRGVIHRDIKPSNIMLDQSNDVYIMDFGISKLVENTAQLTGSGIIGTPTYMSPEQGLGQPIDHRSDIYALGVVLYQMVIGEVPFTAETPMAVLIKHIHEPLPMPTSIRPDLPQGVERVILKSMAKEPDARYETCMELASALQTAVDEAHTGVVKTSIPDPTTDLRPGAIAAGAAALGLGTEAPSDTMIPGVLGDVHTAPTDPPRDKAGKEQQSVERDQRKARKKRRPVVTLALIALVVLLACAGIFAILIANGTIELPDEAAEIIEPDLEIEQSPEDQPIGEPPPEGELPPGMGMACPPDAIEILNLSFPRGDEIALPEGAAYIEIEGRRMVALRPQTEGRGFFPLEVEALDSLIIAHAVFPGDEAGGLSLFSRIGYEEERGYFGHVDREQALIGRQARAGEPEINMRPMPLNIYDGRTHAIEMITTGDAVFLSVDGEMLAEFLDPEALPPGIFGLETEGGVVFIESLLVCTYDREPFDIDDPPQEELPQGEVLFIDNFDNLEQQAAWNWVNEQPWGIEDGRLWVDAPPGITGDNLRDLLNLPALVTGLPDQPVVSSTTIMFMYPEAERQSAGLVLLAAPNRPLALLGRSTCAEENCPSEQAVYLRSAVLRDDGPLVQPAFPPELMEMHHIFLTLTVENNIVIGFFSFDGEHWEPVGEIEIPELLENRRQLRVGVYVSNPSDTLFGAQFEDFVITSGGPPPPPEPTN